MKKIWAMAMAAAAMGLAGCGGGDYVEPERVAAAPVAPQELAGRTERSAGALAERAAEQARAEDAFRSIDAEMSFSIEMRRRHEEQEAAASRVAAGEARSGLAPSCSERAAAGCSESSPEGEHSLAAR